jgi:hypothetical protein
VEYHDHLPLRDLAVQGAQARIVHVKALVFRMQFDAAKAQIRHALKLVHRVVARGYTDRRGSAVASWSTAQSLIDRCWEALVPPGSNTPWRPRAQGPSSGLDRAVGGGMQPPAP